MAEHLSKADILSSSVIAKVSSAIIKERSRLKMTQKEFAQKMNVTQGMVSKWESAEYNFTLENISKICEKVGMSYDIAFTSDKR